jgi:hypothetical protein
MTPLIYGIDPGPERTAVVCYDPERRVPVWGEWVQNIKVISHVLLTPSPVRKSRPEDVYVIEYPQNYGSMMGATTLDTCFACGLITGHLSVNYRYSRPIARPSVKTHLLGVARGNDAQVKRALWNALGEPGTKKDPGPTYCLHMRRGGASKHLWAALAVAVTAAESPESLGEWKGLE